MHVDPYAWLITAPVTIALVYLYFQPSDCTAKRLWGALAQWEHETWQRLSMIGWVGDVVNSARSARTVYVLAVAALGVCSAASFGSFIGVVP